MATYTKAFSTLGCREADLAQVCALADDFGIDAIELRFLEDTIQLPQLWQGRAVSPAQLADQVRSAGKTVPVIDTSLRLFDGTEADRSEVLALLPFAEALGTRYLRVFDGAAAWDAAARRAAAETFEWWDAARSAHNSAIKLIVETHDTLLTAPILKEFLAAFPAATLLWDAHHTWRKGGEAPRVTWEAIAPAVRHVHVKDSVAAPGGKYGLVLPGHGDFPMADLRQLLGGAAWRGVVSLEWEKGWVPHLPPLRDALAVARDGNWW